MPSQRKASETGAAKKKPQAAGGRQRVEPRTTGIVSYLGERCTATCVVHGVSVAGCKLEFDPDDWTNPVVSARSLPGNFKLAVPSLGFEADCSVSGRAKHQVTVKFAGRVRALPPEFRKRRKFKGA